MFQIFHLVKVPLVSGNMANADNGQNINLGIIFLLKEKYYFIFRIIFFALTKNMFKMPVQCPVK